jgi:hypothetical protein
LQAFPVELNQDKLAHGMFLQEGHQVINHFDKPMAQVLGILLLNHYQFIIRLDTFQDHLYLTIEFLLGVMRLFMVLDLFI